MRIYKIIYSITNCSENKKNKEEKMEEIKESDNLHPEYFYIYVEIVVIYPGAGLDSKYVFFFDGYQDFLEEMKYYFINQYLLSSYDCEIFETEEYIKKLKRYLDDYIEDENSLIDLATNIEKLLLHKQISKDAIEGIIEKFNDTFDDNKSNPGYKIIAYGDLKTFISMLVKLKNDELYSLDKELSELQSLSNKEKFDQNDMDQIRSILIMFNLNP
jgi:hypothetical protein